jgi:hypothetical protein
LRKVCGFITFLLNYVTVYGKTSLEKMIVGIYEDTGVKLSDNDREKK